MATNKETKSHAAFHELLDVLRTVADDWLGPDRAVDRELDVVEGLRSTLHLLSAGIDSADRANSVLVRRDYFDRVTVDL